VNAIIFSDRGAIKSKTGTRSYDRDDSGTVRATAAYVIIEALLQLRHGVPHYKRKYRHLRPVVAFIEREIRPEKPAPSLIDQQGITLTVFLGPMMARLPFSYPVRLEKEKRPNAHVTHRLDSCVISIAHSESQDSTFRYCPHGE
jgi:hypothetical protein